SVVVLDHLSAAEGVRHAWVRPFTQRGLVALEAALRGVEAEFGTGRYSFGEELTLADIYLVPQVATAIRYQVPLDPYPTVRRIFEACMKLDAAIASSPENQPDAPAKA